MSTIARPSGRSRAVDPKKPTKKRNWVAIIAAGVAALIVLIFAVPYAYIHFIEAKAPAKLSLGTIGSKTATVPLAGTWSVSSGSEVGYRIEEKIIGQANTAVGRTKTVSGKFVINGTTLESATFTADMRTVKSDQAGRDAQYRGRIMDTSKYPYATFVLTKPVALGALPASGAVSTRTAQGNLTMRGITKPVTMQLSTERAGSKVEVAGSLDLTFANWQIPNPSFGPISTANHGSLEVLLNFTKGAHGNPVAFQKAAPFVIPKSGGFNPNAMFNKHPAAPLKIKAPQG